MGYRHFTPFIDENIMNNMDSIQALADPGNVAGGAGVLLTLAPEIVCNLTLHFTCRDGSCVNATVKCDGYLDCMDGSDEDFCAALPVKRKLTPLEVAAIVLGCIVGTVIICCLLGTVIDCFMHVYKYWCSCLHKAYRCPSEMIALRAQNNNPNDPTVLVVRAIPPSYSTILVSCEPSSQVARCRDSDSQNADPAIIATTDLTNSPIHCQSSPVATHDIPNETSTGSATTTATTTTIVTDQKVLDTATNTDELISMRDMSTQTSRDSGTGDSIDSTSSCNAQRPMFLRGISRSASCILSMRLPPSYSSIFANDTRTRTADVENQSEERVFHNEALVNNDQSQYVYLRPIGAARTETASVEVHAQSSPAEVMDMDLPDYDSIGNHQECDSNEQVRSLVFENGYLKQSKT